MYDYLIVGTGLFGAVCAHELSNKGGKCLVIDKRSHVGGNVFTEKRDGINVHIYGAHIFHTSDKSIWDYVNSFVPFHSFINSPIASYKGKYYNLPFNMNTFYQMWSVRTPEEAASKIEEGRREIKGEPRDLEEQAISLVGRELYEALVKGYTEKQWGRKCTELDPSIIKRLPVRFRFDNNYFNDAYQGMPEDGYTALIERMLDGADVRLNVDFNKNRKEFSRMARKVIYTGMADALYDFKFGELEYRSERFEHKCFDVANMQGVAVINHTDATPAYTRSIEHKHFEFWKGNLNDGKTWVSFEYPTDYKETGEPYYPISSQRNSDLWKKYSECARMDGIILGGRLGLYGYFDMDKTIANALELVKSL